MYIEVWITGLNVYGQLKSDIFLSFQEQYSQVFWLSEVGNYTYHQVNEINFKAHL